MNIPLLLTGLAAGLAHAVYSTLSKAILKEKLSQPLVFLFYANLFQAVLTLGIWLFVSPAVPAREGWTPLLAAAVTCAIAFFFLYAALACGDVSSVMPLMGSKVIFATVLAGIMLKERHGWQVNVAIVLVSIAIAVLSYSPSADQKRRFQLAPVSLMLICCVFFSLSDIYIRQSLDFIDAFNFIVQFNVIVALCSLPIIPYLKLRRASLSLNRDQLKSILLASAFLAVATIFLVLAFQLAQGVVIPNILVATRGVFVVLITAVMTHRGSTALDQQSKGVYAMRFGASLLIILSIAVALN